eukprot:1144499-Pelagomonas_calceolata.AAC.8
MHVLLINIPLFLATMPFDVLSGEPGLGPRLPKRKERKREALGRQQIHSIHLLSKRGHQEPRHHASPPPEEKRKVSGNQEGH